MVTNPPFCVAAHGRSWGSLVPLQARIRGVMLRRRVAKKWANLFNRKVGESRWIDYSPETMCGAALVLKRLVRTVKAKRLMVSGARSGALPCRDGEVYIQARNSRRPNLSKAMFRPRRVPAMHPSADSMQSVIRSSRPRYYFSGRSHAQLLIKPYAPRYCRVGDEWAVFQAVEIQRVFRGHRARGAVKRTLKEKTWAQYADLEGWASLVVQR